MKRYENFPLWVVLLTGLHSVITYGLGFFIIWRLGLIYALIYLAYVFFLELKLIRNHCVDCYYYGKTCGFGKGRLSSWLFEKGDPSRFNAKDMTVKNMIPDLLVTVVPIIAGIIFLVINFDFLILAAILLLIVMMTVGNGFIRGTLTCKYCKQQELGCPADKMFQPTKRE